MDEVKSWARRACHPENIQRAAQQAQRMVADNWRIVFYGLLAAATAIWAAVAISRQVKARKTPTRPGTPELEKSPGTSTTSASKFKTPAREFGGMNPCGMVTSMMLSRPSSMETGSVHATSCACIS